MIAETYIRLVHIYDFKLTSTDLNDPTAEVTIAITGQMVDFISDAFDADLLVH